MKSSPPKKGKIKTRRKVKKSCVKKQVVKGYVSNATIEDLPSEVLSMILSSLSLKDKNTAALTCHRWYNARHHPLIDRDIVYNFASSSYLLSAEVLVTEIQLQNVYVRDAKRIHSTLAFWQRHGRNIKHLTLANCNMKSSDTFAEFITRCPNLVSLNLPHCRDFDLPGRKTPHEQKRRHRLIRALAKLRQIDLSYHSNLTNNFFSKLVTLAPNLTSLNLTGSCISDFSRVPSDSPGYNLSREHISFPNLVKYVSNKAQNIKTLYLSKTAIEASSMTQLMRISKLTLTGLHLESCMYVCDSAVELICKHQKSLEELDLSFCYNLTNDSIKCVTTHLLKLKCLAIQSILTITDRGIEDMWRLEKLERLNLSGCSTFLDEGVTAGLCSRLNLNMVELRLHGLRSISEKSIISLAPCVPNLELLDVGYCSLAMTDPAMQAIIEHNTKLRTLCLINCDRLTDAGFTGRGLLDTTSYIKHCTIGQTHKRRRVSGVSIRYLRALRNLSLSGCSKLTDMSLGCVFYFPELQTLDISLSHITDRGVLALTKNIKSLEKLTLYQCHSVGDKSVRYIINNCKQLKEVFISSKKLTEDAEQMLSTADFSQYRLYRKFD